MRVALGADHRGFLLKEKLKALLRRQGHTVVDKGPFSADRCDYPDSAFAVARAVARHRVGRGVLVCSTGIGMSIAANRVPGVRAALCLDPHMARMSREHNNANVLCLGADLASPQLAARILSVWLRTAFAGGRHRRRVRKLARCPREC
ncbi:ribose 5-phosphate isomerase B [candidate division WOR-3 bacterium]|nr:ribose 5-phosphate isomerase B [candidate division WOR-3 bacterium]